MPILSNSLVTRPLTEAELRGLQLTHARPSSPTRARCASTTGCCSDNRLQIGSRSAITGADAAEPAHHAAADRCARTQVPAARRHRDRLLVVGLGRRQPRHDAAHRPARPGQRILYALGYGGNGVSFSAHAGKRLAERIAGAGGDHWTCRSTARRCRATGRAVPARRPGAAVPLVLPARRDPVEKIGRRCPRSGGSQLRRGCRTRVIHCAAPRRAAVC